MTRGMTELGDVTVHNIKQLKRLNQVVFPVSYNDKFYKDVLEGGELAKLGTKMVQHVLSYVEKDGNFDSIFLHVQVNNEVAIEFYKCFGFEVVETKEHYYKRIEPADAHVLQKTLRAARNGNLTNGTFEINNHQHQQHPQNQNHHYRQNHHHHHHSQQNQDMDDTIA